MAKLQENLLNNLGEEYIRKKGVLWLKVISSSMEPLIDIDDRILATTIRPEEVKMGDVVIFRRNSSPFITHRVIGWRRVNGVLQFLEKGDRNSIATWIPATYVMAKVIQIKRKDERIVMLNTSNTILANKFFALYHLAEYVYGEIIRRLKVSVKRSKTSMLLKYPYRYVSRIMRRGQFKSKKILVHFFFK